MKYFEDYQKYLSEKEKIDLILNTKPDRAVYHIDVGVLPLNEASEVIEKFKRKIKNA